MLNSPPGRLRPKGSGGLRVLAPLSPRTSDFSASFSGLFHLKAPSHHTPPPHFPLLLFAAGIFPLFGCAIIWGLGAGGSAVQDASIPRDPPASHFGIVFLVFFVLFRNRFRHPLFNVFFSFLPPFFQCFFNEFPMHFTSHFSILFGDVLEKALLQNFIFFRMPPFWATCVLHSKHNGFNTFSTSKMLGFYFGKNKKKQFFA